MTTYEWYFNLFLLVFDVEEDVCQGESDDVGSDAVVRSSVQVVHVFASFRRKRQSEIQGMGRVQGL